jgi:hypothetical protein
MGKDVSQGEGRFKKGLHIKKKKGGKKGEQKKGRKKRGGKKGEE